MQRHAVLVSASLLAISVAGEASAQSADSHGYDPLGRLVVSATTGGPGDDDARSTCYDAAGNRTEYRSSNDGSVAVCTPTPSPPVPPPPASAPPPPPPVPPPSNYPPNAVNDSLSGTCQVTSFINLTVNDTDPDGHYPLTITSIIRTSGQANAFIHSSSTAEVFFGPSSDLSSFTYTVEDSLGAGDTGVLWLSTSSCGGGPPPE
jgi:Bacterial Ig domain